MTTDTAETVEKPERVTMAWPPGLKDRIREKVGQRDLTKYTVAALERHLQDSDLLEDSGTEANEAKHLCQLLADRLAMGGTDQDRREALMELELPGWVETTGWPAEMAKLVRPEPAPAPEPVKDEAPVEIKEAGPAAEGARDDLFARVMQRTGGELEPGFKDLKTASELSVPEKPPVQVHNHAWERTDGVLRCSCGAWIDDSDPAYPNGIVRGPDWARDDGQPAEAVTVHESTEAFLEHLDKVAAEPIPPMPVTEPANAVAAPTVEPAAVVMCPNGCGDELIDGECWTCA